MRQASESNELRLAPAPRPVHGVDDRSVFRDTTCGNCSDTEELIRKVVSGTRRRTQGPAERTNPSCLGLVDLEVEIRHVLALSKRHENEVSLIHCQR